MATDVTKERILSKELYMYYKGKSDEALMRIFLRSGDMTQSFFSSERELHMRGYSPARIIKRYEQFIRRQVRCQES